MVVEEKRDVYRRGTMNSHEMAVLYKALICQFLRPKCDQRRRVPTDPQKRALFFLHLTPMSVRIPVPAGPSSVLQGTMARTSNYDDV